MRHNKRALGVFLAAVLALSLASTVSIAQTSAYDYILRGERYLASGAADEAIREFKAALSMEPGNTRASLGLGQAYEQRSKCARVFNYRMELMTELETIGKLGFPPLTDQGYQDVGLALDAYSKAVASYPHAEAHTPGLAAFCERPAGWRRKVCWSGQSPRTVHRSCRLCFGVCVSARRQRAGCRRTDRQNPVCIRRSSERP